MERLCIYPNDIQIITGKSERQCRNIITEIKKLHNKQKHQVVSVEELCMYLGLNEDKVKQTLKR